MQTASRALVAAVMTLGLGAVAGIIGFRSAWVVFAPGFLAAWFGTGSEGGGLVAFAAVNVGVWWTAWAAVFLIWGRVLTRPDAEPLSWPTDLRKT